MKEVNVHIDFDNLDQLALEITKAYLDKNSDNSFRSPKEYTRIFITTYSRIVAELNIVKQDKDLLTNLISNAMKIDFSEYENNN